MANTALMKADLNDTFIFVTVGDLGSFANAARHLGLPASTISRRVARLERHLDLRLIRRTTRKRSLTDVGEVYFNHARRELESIRGHQEKINADLWTRHH
ncbi:MAG: LysR family transcriptional regulator [Chromatiales bacterium]|jgi:DNA-binding transcriptional LysR family regulator|nr:LysR family transcriptional regulator [Chromatiales bacterium]